MDLQSLVLGEPQKSMPGLQKGPKLVFGRRLVPTGILCVVKHNDSGWYDLLDPEMGFTSLSPMVSLWFSSLAMQWDLFQGLAPYV